MAVTQYIGARYVPIFADPAEWSNTKQYEPLTIVLHEGNSYTSRQFVPIGVDIDNTDFWAETGNYNAQVEAYRNEVETYRNEVEHFADSIQEKTFSFDTVTEMQESANLYIGAICHTNGFHTNGDGGAAWYIISDIGEANGMDVLECGYMFANLIQQSVMSPEMYGAYGDNIHDDIQQLKRAIDSSSSIVGNNKYKISSTLILDKTCFIDLLEILYTGDTYALSIGNGCFNSNISINYIHSNAGGVVFETSGICGRMCFRFNVITAEGGSAFDFVGGSGGVLDCSFYGEVWEGTSYALNIKPKSSYIGNIKFNGIRFTATSERGTALNIDSTNGSITQLFFPECSLEPKPNTTNLNGITITFVNTIEEIRGYFRTTELNGIAGHILKIAGTVNTSTKIPECLYLDFDYLLGNKIDLSELSVPRYYAIDNPIAIINVGKFIFASQPQATQIKIIGNRITFKPNRRTYTVVSNEYKWNGWNNAPVSFFEATGNVTIYLPSWLEPLDYIQVMPATHTVTIKYIDFGGAEIQRNITGSANAVLNVGIYRVPSGDPYIFVN